MRKIIIETPPEKIIKRVNSKMRPHTFFSRIAPGDGKSVYGKINAFNVTLYKPQKNISALFTPSLKIKFTKSKQKSIGTYYFSRCLFLNIFLSLAALIFLTSFILYIADDTVFAFLSLLLCAVCLFPLFHVSKKKKSELLSEVTDTDADGGNKNVPNSEV